MLKICEINTKQEFYELKKHWDEALTKSIENHIFLTWEKMAPSVNHLDKNSTIKILCATENEKIVAIAPFRLTHKGLKGPLGYGIIEPLTNGETDYADFIITERQEECLNEFFEYLCHQKNWDFMYLPDFPQTSPTLKTIKTIKLPTLEIQKGEICPYIALPDSNEKLHQNIDKKLEKKLKKSLTKLEQEKGKVKLKEYREIGSLEKAIDILIDLHQKRWVSKGISGRFMNEKAQEITYQTAKYFDQNNWLRLYFLTVNDIPVAVELNLEYKGKMYCHLKGFDPDYYRYRVGSLLTLKVLEQCIDRGITEFDFMQGNEAYKFEWTDKYRQNTTIKMMNTRVYTKVIKVGLEMLKETTIGKIAEKYLTTLRSISNN